MAQLMAIIFQTNLTFFKKQQKCRWALRIIPFQTALPSSWLYNGRRNVVCIRVPHFIDGPLALIAGYEIIS